MRLFQRNGAKQNGANQHRPEPNYYEEEPEHDFQEGEVDTIQRKLKDMQQVFQKLPNTEDKNLDVEEALKVAEQIRQLADSLTGITGPKHPSIGTSFSIESKSLLPRPGRQSKSSRADKHMEYALTSEQPRGGGDYTDDSSELSGHDHPISPTLARAPKGEVARKVALMESIWTEQPKTPKPTLVEKRVASFNRDNSFDGTTKKPHQPRARSERKDNPKIDTDGYTASFSGVSALVERFSQPTPTWASKGASSQLINTSNGNLKIEDSTKPSLVDTTKDQGKPQLVEILSESSGNSQMPNEQGRRDENQRSTTKQIFRALDEHSRSKSAAKERRRDDETSRKSMDKDLHKQNKASRTDHRRNDERSSKSTDKDSRQRSKSSKTHKRSSSRARSVSEMPRRTVGSVNTNNSKGSIADSSSRAESRTHLLSLPVSSKRSKSEIRRRDEWSVDKSTALSSVNRYQQQGKQIIQAPILEIIAHAKTSTREPSSFNPQAEWDYRNPHYAFDYQPASPSINYRSIKSHGSTVSSLSTRSLRAARIRKKIWKMICGKVNEPKRIEGNPTATTLGDNSIQGNTQKKNNEREDLHRQDLHRHPSPDLYRSSTFAGNTTSKSHTLQGTNGIRRSTSAYDASPTTKNYVSFSEHVPTDRPRMTSEYHSDVVDLSRSNGDVSLSNGYDQNMQRKASHMVSKNDYSLKKMPSNVSHANERVTEKPSTHNTDQMQSNRVIPSNLVDDSMKRKQQSDESHRRSETSNTLDDSRSHASMSNLSGSTGAFSIAELVKYMSFKDNLERGFEILLNDSEGFRKKYFPNDSEKDKKQDDRKTAVQVERDYDDDDEQREFPDSPSMTLAMSNRRHRFAAENSTDSSTERTKKLLDTLETPRGIDRTRSKDNKYRGPPSIEKIPSRSSFDKGYHYDNSQKRTSYDHYSYRGDEVKQSASNLNARSRDLVRE